MPGVGWIDATQLAIVQSFLREQGYKAGAPTNQMLTGRFLAMREVCCCGEKGLLYSPWHLDKKVRAFVVCPVCGHAKEA